MRRPVVLGPVRLPVPADDAKAYAYAALSGALNSLVEVGGGIDKLPDVSKNALKEWAGSMIDEGKEEVVQGMISQALQRGMYGVFLRLGDILCVVPLCLDLCGFLCRLLRAPGPVAHDLLQRGPGFLPQGRYGGPCKGGGDQRRGGFGRNHRQLCRRPHVG